MDRKSELTFKYPYTLINAHPACSTGRWCRKFRNLATLAVDVAI